MQRVQEDIQQKVRTRRGQEMHPKQLKFSRNVFIINYNLFGGHENSKKRCWYMHFTSSLVPHPQLKLVNKFGNLNSIKLTLGYYKLTLGRNQTTFRNLEIYNFVLHPLATGSTHSVDKPFPTCSHRGDTIVILGGIIYRQLYLIRPSLPDYYQCMNPSQAQPD